MTRTLKGMAEFALGLAALGRPGYMTLGHHEDLADKSREGLFRQSFEVLDFCWRQGIHRVDVARSYGAGEEIVAQWLAHSKAKVFVSSKWGYRYTADWQVNAAVHEVKDHSLAHLNAQWQQTQRTLGEHVHLYQIHSATLESGVLDDDAVLNRLAEIRAQTGTRIGLSVTGTKQGEVIDKALGIRRDGRELFSSVQATWNLLERSAGPALQRAHAAGWLTLIKEPLANGRLTERGDVSSVRDTARKMGATPDAVALAAVLQQPFVDVVLLGATTVAQVASNLRAKDVSNAEPVVQTVREEGPEVYWAHRARLPWT